MCQKGTKVPYSPPTASYTIRVPLAPKARLKRIKSLPTPLMRRNLPRHLGRLPLWTRWRWQTQSPWRSGWACEKRFWSGTPEHPPHPPGGPGRGGGQATEEGDGGRDRIPQHAGAWASSRRSSHGPRQEHFQPRRGALAAHELGNIEGENESLAAGRERSDGGGHHIGRSTSCQQAQPGTGHGMDGETYPPTAKPFPLAGGVQGKVGERPVLPHRHRWWSSPASSPPWQVALTRPFS